ncbi:drug/metabolite transporter (DMT)-like permease [Natronocella acetinitrilica]|jgi:drug/metabolite transporter (DMT)-like permease|uniref:Drug/metabolite transporter (DMT)-like permease n=1 Tax=Natronocella acetinitrilica TaxID=414046 RepID=A0AAE3G5E6_9GAMM|nr:DMT family transporter [Natronocella acetinitrilica]MCP1675969.1 drug/metabolite transporter (DMT)-like permease [Natronocella acetinitrilica]
MTGVLLMAGGVSLLPLMDGVAKHLVTDFPVFQVVWARFTFHLLWMLPVLWLLGLKLRDLWPTRPGVQLIRSGFLLGATVSFFAAIRYMPIADALALLFISPMVCTLLSPLALGERIGPVRWLAVVAGFVGALIVVRPGFGVFHWASLLALSAGVFHGCYLLTTRVLSGSSPPSLTLAYTAVVGMVAMSLLMPAGIWVAPGAGDWALMILMGLLGACGHYLIIKSFERAAAPVVAPVGYVEILSATAVGYWFFSDFPDAWTWFGIAIIVLGGVLITLHDGTRRARPPPPDGGSGGAVI